MSCFSSLGFWENLCILIVVIIAIWSLIQLLLPYLLQYLPALVIGIIRIAFLLVIGIICIKIIFDLLGCLVGAGGGLGFHH